MAQAFFEALAGVPGMDSQTAMAVQSLLESQNMAETAAATPTTTSVEDEDVFQCGKCKKQFTSLVAFVGHKQEPCNPAILPPAPALQQPSHLRIQTQPVINCSSSAFTATVFNKQSVGNLSQVPASPMTSNLNHSVMLSDDLMAFTAVDQGTTLQVGSSLQGNNPFLSQVGPLTPKSTALSSSISLPTVTSSGYSSNNSAFTSTLQGGQIQLLQTPSGNTVLQSDPQCGQPQQVIVSTSVASGTAGLGKTVTLVKPNAGKGTVKLPVNSSPNKITVLGNNLHLGGGNATLATTPQGLITVITDMDNNIAQSATTLPKVRRTKAGVEEPSLKKRLKCQYCDKAFCKNFDLQQHVRSHTGEKPFQCIVCGRAFAQKSNVKKHMQTHKVWPSGVGSTLPNQPSATIPICIVTSDETGVDSQRVAVQVNQETSNASLMEVNIDSKQDDQGNLTNIVIDNAYVCQYCHTRFKSFFQLKSHMIMHKTEQVYKCILKTCGHTFQDLDSFLEHTKTHEDDMSYRCHMCNKHFASLYELGVHQYSHSLYPNQGPKPGPRYFRCSKCSNKYSTPESLQHHMETTTHNYGCRHCDRVFTCERYLRRHLPLHGSVGEHECEYCEKRFKTEHYLKMHMLIHSTEKPFKCDHCTAAFNRKDKLRRHILIHEINKRYKCPFRTHTGCMKEFNRPDKLKAHIISHSGIKPYKCHECGRSFTRKPHLREHMRSHRKDYRFTCQICSRGFLREKLFQLHKCRIKLEKPDNLESAALLQKDAGVASRVGNPLVEKTADETVESVMAKLMPKRPRGMMMKRRAAPKNKRRMITVTPDMIKSTKVSVSKRGRHRKLVGPFFAGPAGDELLQSLAQGSSRNKIQKVNPMPPVSSVDPKVSGSSIVFSAHELQESVQDQSGGNIYPVIIAPGSEAGVQYVQSTADGSTYMSGNAGDGAEVVVLQPVMTMGGGYDPDVPQYISLAPPGDDTHNDYTQTAHLTGDGSQILQTISSSDVPQSEMSHNPDTVTVISVSEQEQSAITAYNIQQGALFNNNSSSASQSLGGQYSTVPQATLISTGPNTATLVVEGQSYPTIVSTDADGGEIEGTDGIEFHGEEAEVVGHFAIEETGPEADEVDEATQNFLQTATGKTIHIKTE